MYINLEQFPIARRQPVIVDDNMLTKTLEIILPLTNSAEALNQTLLNFYVSLVKSLSKFSKFIC